MNSVVNVVISCLGEDDGYIGYKKELLNYKIIKKKLWYCYKLYDYMILLWIYVKYIIFLYLRYSMFMFDKVEVLKFIS